MVTELLVEILIKILVGHFFKLLYILQLLHLRQPHRLPQLLLDALELGVFLFDLADLVVLAEGLEHLLEV